MTLFHFINCMGVACAPYLIVYRYSGLSEYAALPRCLRAGAGYLITQLLKMTLVATLFPTDPVNEESIQSKIVRDTVRCTLNALDFLGLYTVLTRFLGRGEMKVLVATVGWGTAEVLTSKLLPMWVRARGMEFQWYNFQTCVDSNIDLILLLSNCALLWLWSRKNLTKTASTLTAVMLAFVCYRKLLFRSVMFYFGIDLWIILGAKLVFALAFGLLTLHMHTAMVVAKRSS